MRKRFRLAGMVAVVLSLYAGPIFADYAEEWGPKVGTALPMLSAPDHTGQVRTLADIQGENGVLILFNRSADW